MAPSNLSFSLLILSFLLLAMLTQKVHSQTFFNISAFTPHSLKLTYEGDAFVPPDTTYVRLVPGNNWASLRVGRVLYSAPVKLWDASQQASFDTTITFRIFPMGLYDDPSYGMTFFMVPVNSTKTTPAYVDERDLGIYGSVIAGSPIFAVQFDMRTKSNPTIGININSRTSQNTASFPNATREFVTARITYDVPTRKISVVATYGSRKATVRFAYNLKALLPQQVQVGLSASTTARTFACYYDAYSWHFNSTMVSDVNSAVDDNTYIKKYVMR
ncbi:hypothetical protein ACS0TY_009368 [Phlomoides rotata]